nr:hypothetical protein KPHV_07410 [Kitasatospora purpeofusca]
MVFLRGGRLGVESEPGPEMSWVARWARSAASRPKVCRVTYAIYEINASRGVAASECGPFEAPCPVRMDHAKPLAKTSYIKYFLSHSRPVPTAIGAGRQSPAGMRLVSSEQ